MDLHAGQIQGFFDIPVDNLYAQPVLYQYVAASNLVTEDPSETVIVSPDAGGVERARSVREARSAPSLAIIDKRRSAPNEAEVMHIIGDVKDKVAIIIDDMIDTAGTLSKGGAALKEAGARKIFAVATHPVLSRCCSRRRAPDSKRRRISLTLRPALSASDRVTTPCDRWAIRANFFSAVSSRGPIWAPK